MKKSILMVFLFFVFVPVYCYAQDLTGVYKFPGVPTMQSLMGVNKAPGVPTVRALLDDCEWDSKTHTSADDMMVYYYVKGGEVKRLAYTAYHANKHVFSSTLTQYWSNGTPRYKMSIRRDGSIVGHDDIEEYRYDGTLKSKRRIISTEESGTKTTSLIMYDSKGMNGVNVTDLSNDFEKFEHEFVFYHKNMSSIDEVTNGNIKIEHFDMLTQKGGWIEILISNAFELDTKEMIIDELYKIDAVLDLLFENKLSSVQESTLLNLKKLVQDKEDYLIKSLSVNNDHSNSIRNFQSFKILNSVEVVKSLSLRTGSSSMDLVEQLETLMQQWVDNEGLLIESDRLLLFGNEDKAGVYNYVYDLVLNGNVSNVEDLKFFLILSGAVAWQNHAATTNLNFGTLGRDALKLISASYASFGMNSQTKTPEIDKSINARAYIKGNTRFVDFFKMGTSAIIKK